MCAKQRNTINIKKQKKDKTIHAQSITRFPNGRCKKCFNYNCRCCDKFFVLNFAGLTDNINFQLFKFKGEKAEIETVFGTKEVGVIYNFGIDFLEIKEKDGVVVTILKDKISKINIFVNGGITLPVDSDPVSNNIS